MLEQKLEINNKKIDLERISYTTIGYGLVGTLYPNPEITAPIAGLIGCAASVYDEVKDKKLNLTTPAISTIVGGVIGYLFDSPELVEQIPHISIYTGSLIGGALGSYKSFKERRKN